MNPEQYDLIILKTILQLFQHNLQLVFQIKIMARILRAVSYSGIKSLKELSE